MPFAHNYHQVADWRLVEERLAAEADSLGDLLAMLEAFVPSSLLDESGWRSVLEVAGCWPVSLGALPFGFEFHLLDPSPRADFGVTLAPGGNAAEWISRSAESATAPEYLGRLARTLAEMKTGASAAGRELGRIMLEFDLAATVAVAPPAPGIFLYYHQDATHGRPDSYAVLSALNAACGWSDQAGEFDIARRFSLAVKNPVAFVGLGAFPVRGREFRLTASRFPTSADALSFLREIGWPGRYDLLTDVLERMTRQRAYHTLGLMLSGHGDCLRSKLGLYLRHYPRGWPGTFEALAAEGCVAAKLAGLESAADNPIALWGKSGEYNLLREVTHIKLALTDAGCEDIKAYFALVLAP